MRRLLAGGSLVVGAGGLALWFAPRWLVPLLAAWSPGCTYTLPTSERALALTFDDGPDPRTTRELLALLSRYDARATFFLISSTVPDQAALLRRLVQDGHEIGNHLTRDEASIRLSAEEFERALLEADRVLREFGPVRWVRPGSGWYNAAMLSVMARHGYRCALGSVYPLDAHIPSPTLASMYILAHARPGAIVILHDRGARGARTAAILRRILPALRDRGYRLVTLSQLSGEKGKGKRAEEEADSEKPGCPAPFPLLPSRFSILGSTLLPHLR